VDNSVFDRYIVPLYKQASYKPYIIAAMIFMAQVKDPVKALMELDETKDTAKKEERTRAGGGGPPPPRYFLSPAAFLCKCCG